MSSTCYFRLAISVYCLWNHARPFSLVFLAFPSCSLFFSYFQTLVCNFLVSLLISISSPTSSNDYHVRNWNRSQYDMFRLSSAQAGKKTYGLWRGSAELWRHQIIHLFSQLFSYFENANSLVRNWLKLRHTVEFNTICEILETLSKMIDVNSSIFLHAPNL